MLFRVKDEQWPFIFRRWSYINAATLSIFCAMFAVSLLLTIVGLVRIGHEPVSALLGPLAMLVLTGSIVLLFARLQRSIDYSRKRHGRERGTGA